MEERVEFRSAGLKISGILHKPEGMKPGEKRPAVMVLHGFGSNKLSSNCILPCKMLAEWGYAALRFDFRGCGESEGPKSRVVCLEQVEDTSSALTYLAVAARHRRHAHRRLRLELRRRGRGLRGRRRRARGGGDLERRLGRRRNQVPPPARLARGMGALHPHDGRRQAGQEGRPPDHGAALRHRADPAASPRSISRTARSWSSRSTRSRACSVSAPTRWWASIAPRPLLLLHSSNDSVTPTEQSVRLFEHARQPTDLHLFAETDHFMFSGENPRVISVIRDWLNKYFPARA